MRVIYRVLLGYIFFPRPRKCACVCSFLVICLCVFFECVCVSAHFYWMNSFFFCFLYCCCCCWNSLPQSSSHHTYRNCCMFHKTIWQSVAFVANVFAFFSVSIITRLFFFCRYVFRLYWQFVSGIALVLECAQPISLIIHALNAGPKTLRHRYCSKHLKSLVF